MQLTNQNLKTLSQYAKTAAFEAGKMLRNFSLDNLKINQKEHASSLASAVVTEADLKSQDIILNALHPTLSKFDLALLSEESPDDQSRFEKEYFWCIDPIDGTLPFTEGKPGYAVSIALVSKGGESLIGVVYNPPSNTLWHAIKGLGAYQNDLPLSQSISRGNSNRFHYLVDLSFLSDPSYNETVRFLKAHHQSHGHEISLAYIGGAVMQAMTALQYENGAYFKLPKKGNSGGSIWDYAATHCLYGELNYHATDIYRNPMDLNRLDSTFMNHQGILYGTNEKICLSVQALISSLQRLDKI